MLMLLVAEERNCCDDEDEAVAVIDELVGPATVQRLIEDCARRIMLLSLPLFFFSALLRAVR